MQRRHHYERAFEEFLRVHRIPYVAVDEARKALLPCSASQVGSGPALKSFDFVVYGQSGNLLIDIKGRQAGVGRSGGLGRLESWVTEDDVACLRQWEQLFGAGFEAVFIFVYWCAAQPPDALFQEVFEHGGQWYALRSVGLDEYVRAMKPRSPRWRTVDVPTRVFEQISQPFAPSALLRGGLGIRSPEPLLEPLEMVG